MKFSEQISDRFRELEILAAEMPIKQEIARGSFVDREASRHAR
jgi:hypothetical protein